MSLQNKKFLIIVTGSIASYKACEIIRILRKEKCEVQVMMTESAQKFIGKATFSALTNNEVLTDMFPDTPKAGLEHIEHALNMDAILVIPATANILGKVASGIADDLVSTTLSVCEQPTLFAPAMNYRMWQNPATIEAVDKLRNRGKLVLNPEVGALASLHEGEGRLPEISDIMNGIRELFEISLPLKGKKVLVTAGPTREAIDPVRFVSNRSSGKMGYAIAEVARNFGANVTLISGPVSLPPVPEIEMIKVETADDMLLAVQNCLVADQNSIDFLFMVAAVSDYQLENIEQQKIKRSKEELNLIFIPAPDILKSINGNIQGKTIAFALETENGEEYALRKMKEKGADYIVLNYANEQGAGFESSTNRVTVFSKSGKKIDLAKNRKDRIAKQIIEFVLNNE
ncbi:MAG: bifunctional phosphopantothenoylcysteine decarboxylase/phosphopantothenate--cysteine ligase CoaBC [Candidatus Marinimicrobia bacterium]|nr:bifunctional phosphopantothenoylcysteine decarboxylase/phosphopantothenate--cysteine ligase CoaBC [Candidatus Neomarinimicrobiota bacterium]MBL7022946.1 bifunctional phosphopantothenoylcysteine decarboxylase/phosphopantothenate--cysteine ligase CoaBC [Candidatus Neomarinimicrobiota bacterium]MBL7108764.1 bifunctional phosphopantothenoylcysteine decarboxylase/phosphopantothenate--cysteine ligase CoaBC [Candidatus Neomarinimicrobiota bacterium]